MSPGLTRSFQLEMSDSSISFTSANGRSQKSGRMMFACPKWVSAVNQISPLRSSLFFIRYGRGGSCTPNRSTTRIPAGARDYPEFSLPRWLQGPVVAKRLAGYLLNVPTRVDGLSVRR